MCCNKFLLFAINAIVFVLGLIGIGVSSSIIHKGSDYGELITEGVFPLTVVVLIVGILVTTIGFLGCFGSITENKCMLNTYAGIVLILFLCEIALGILILTKPETIQNSLKTALTNQFNNYDTDAGTEKAVDSMQRNLKCCGVEGPSDWSQLWIAPKKKQVPSSCCPETEINCFTYSDDVYKTGCYDALVNEFKGSLIALGVSGIILAIFMFTSMSMAFAIARKR